MLFPFGKAPLALLLLSLCTGALLAVLMLRQTRRDYDLTFTIFARNHYEAYEEVLPQFEAEHGVSVNMQLATTRALQDRLQAAMLAGAEVPDVVEIVNGSMGYFTRGPLEDVGFRDLTDRLESEGLREGMVESRFSLWSSRGRIFALPHDVHPVMLAYRKDIVEDELGIDPATLTTWDEFIRVGRQVTRDADGDGTTDRYMLDLPEDGGQFELFLLQRGGGLFDADGNVTFDNDLALETVIWYIHMTRGDGRICFPAGWGQTLAKAMLDGLVLFYICPDWRTKFFEKDVASLEGKLGLIPLPAWKKGGCRTSTWGGTGLAITKNCRKPELAWKLAKFLYLRNEDLAARFSATNIIPPVKDAWDLPAFHHPDPFFSNLPVGSLYAELAPETPPDYVTAYTEMARTKVREAMLNSAIHYEDNGDAELETYVRKELTRCADYVRRSIARNRFLVAGE